MSSRLPRRLFPLLLALSLAVPVPAAAAIPLLGAEALIWKIRAVLFAFWEESASPVPSTSPIANGCVLDSHGGCAAVLLDTGCDIDPFGKCRN